MEYGAEVAQLEQVWQTYVQGPPEEQLARWRKSEPDVEVRMSVPTLATQRVLIAVCKRFGLRLYRRPRQKQSTMCVQAPAGFMEKVLHPLLQGMAEVVEEAAHQTTTRIIDRWRQGTSDASHLS